MENNCSISGRFISLMPAVQDNVVERMTGVHLNSIERVFTELHEPPCPNKIKDIEGKTIGDILHMFWLEFKYFQHNTGPFDKETRWLTNNVLVGKSHVWHGFYSLPYTGVLGFIDCIVCSKPLGIGIYGNIWGGFNNIKTGRRSLLGGESTKKCSVFYNTEKIHDAKINKNIMEILMKKSQMQCLVMMILSRFTY